MFFSFGLMLVSICAISILTIALNREFKSKRNLAISVVCMSAFGFSTLNLMYQRGFNTMNSASVEEMLKVVKGNDLSCYYKGTVISGIFQVLGLTIYLAGQDFLIITIYTIMIGSGTLSSNERLRMRLSWLNVAVNIIVGVSSTIFQILGQVVNSGNLNYAGEIWSSSFGFILCVSIYRSSRDTIIASAVSSLMLVKFLQFTSTLVGIVFSFSRITVKQALDPTVTCETHLDYTLPMMMTSMFFRLLTVAAIGGFLAVIVPKRVKSKAAEMVSGTKVTAQPLMPSGGGATIDTSAKVSETSQKN